MIGIQSGFYSRRNANLRIGRKQCHQVIREAEVDSERDRLARLPLKIQVYEVTLNPKP